MNESSHQDVASLNASASSNGLSTSAFGILCIVGAILILSTSDSIIKWLSPRYALHEIMLIRSLVALSITLVFIHLEGGIRILKTNRPVLHILRALLIVAANMFFFLGLASMPFADAVAIFFVSPLLITILSQPVLGERVGPVRWLAVCFGLVGVVLMLRPGSGVFEPVALLPLFAAMCYSMMQMLTRKLGIASKASTLTFYIQITFCIVSALAGLVLGGGEYAGGDNPTLDFLFRAWTLPTVVDGLFMTVCGVLVAFGGYLMSQAYRVAQAAVVAPFEYVGLPMAVVWGYLIWGDWPDVITFIGGAMTVSAGIIVFYREHRHRVRPRTKRINQ